MAYAFSPAISVERLAETVPAAFATEAAPTTSERYRFISTAELVSALLDAGFIATSAFQGKARTAAGTRFARHMLTFQYPRMHGDFIEAIPQIALINAHDGTSPYQLRNGLLRPICKNGLMTPIGDFGLIYVPHRGNVVANVVEAALELTKGFARVTDIVKSMLAQQLTHDERVHFANQALAIRWEGFAPVQPLDVLGTRRSQDDAHSLWTTFNVLQENLVRGGLIGKTEKGRNTRTRGIHAVRESVRINHELWLLAIALLGT